MSTGNPIGSPDFRDAYLNAKNLDYAINGDDDTYTDRFGVVRPTFKGMEKKTLPKGSIEYLSARMDAGEIVKFAVFGDSTVDGFGTSDWIGNPTSGGNAVGNSNHNLTSPNSYPVLLESLLREMFNNNNISVFNAGYAGKSLVDGWALNNFEKAIIDNPFYGKPDVVFIDFGLNDARPEGSQIVPFKEQLFLLIDKIVSYGILPIILTCDPVLRNYNVTNAVFNGEITKQIDMVKYDVAKLRNVPIITKGEQLRDWANNNGNGYRWFLEQSTDVDSDGDFSTGDDVGLHFKDIGHRIKAQILAKTFFKNTVIMSGKVESVTSNDSRSNSFGNFLLTLSGDSSSNSRQGFSFRVDYKDPNLSHQPAGPRAPMSTIWVWSEIPDCEVIYNGLIGEGWGTDAPDTPIDNPLPPAVSIKSFVDNETLIKIPPTVGFRYSGVLKPSDIPYTVGKLKYGLNKVQYLCGDLGHYARGSKSLFFYGFFDFKPPTPPCLNGPRIHNFLPLADTIIKDGFDCTFGVMSEEKLVFLIEADMAIGTGVSLLGSSTFFGLGGDKKDGYGSIQSTVLYRHDDTRWRIANAKYALIANELLSTPINVAFTPTQSNGTVTLRIEISRSFLPGDFGAGKQTIKIYDGYKALDNKLLQTTEINAPNGIPVQMGGIVGGYYSNKTLNLLGGDVILKALTVFKI